jgi:drug/metabolite transporter (DMT)-like permease
LPNPTDRRRGDETTGKLLLLLLTLAWGVNWPSVKIALFEVSPWTFRVANLAIGGLAVAAVVMLRGRSVLMPAGRIWAHVAIAGFFNVAAFSIFSTFALRDTTSSRVVILVYTMPIWSTLLARLLLGEQLTALRLLALALCASGLAVLLAPHMPLTDSSLWYALATAGVWAAGTIYMKWARIQADAMTIAFWQIAIGWAGVAAAATVLGEPWFVWPQHTQTIVAWIYSSVFGVGLAYFMWFMVIERLPASTASLGSLMIPVVGVASSALLLGERPTLHDMIGFAFVFAAAACVLLQPSRNLAAARGR